MIKRDITETIYEYDKEGKLIKKTVTETHEEDSNITDVSYPYVHKSWPYEITCTDNASKTAIQKDTVTLSGVTSISDTIKG